MRASVLPPSLPPRGLSRAQAAEYIGVSVTKLDEMIRDGRMPPPKRVDSRTIWDRLQLDEAFSALDGVKRNPGLDVLNSRKRRPKETDSDNADRALAMAQGTEEMIITCSGGYPMAVVTATNYEKFGLEAITMDASGMKLRLDAAVAEWKETVRNSPLNKREKLALSQFRGRQAGTIIERKEIKLGVVTGERLEARGWIEICLRSNEPDNREGYILTNAGFKALDDLVSRLDFRLRPG